MQFMPISTPINAEDEVAFGRNINLLREGFAKPKEQVEVLKELMRRTFSNQWDVFISKNEPATLLDYPKEYPLLKKASYVHYNLGSVVVESECVHI